MRYIPWVVSWNLTRACNLRCPHCYIAADHPAPGELATDDALSLIDELSALGTQLLILTGGEPLLRGDLLTLARHASNRGLVVVLGTNGTLLDENMAQRLKDSGVQGVGISLDSISPEKHDAFRGLDGAWERAWRAIAASRQVGLEVAIQTTVLPMNHGDIPQLIQFAHATQARAFNAYFLVCTGRGEQLTDITPEQYEAVLNYLIEAQWRYAPMLVRAKCAPHIKRLASLKYSRSELQSSTAATVLSGAGCLAGTSYLRITPEGDITPCPYLPTVLGNVQSQPLRQIWDHAAVFQQLRSSQRGGRCGVCEFRELCGGCRARAFALTRDVLGEDPWCAYQPNGHEVRKTTQIVTWTAEAQARIERAPLFIRGPIIQGVEAVARARGISTITPELLAELRAAFVGRTRREQEERHVS